MCRFPWRGLRAPPHIVFIIIIMVENTATSGSSSTSASAEEEHFVHPELHKKIQVLQKAFSDITETLLDKSSQNCELQTTEQVRAAIMRSNKPVIADMLAKLYHAAGPLCTIAYLPDNGKQQPGQVIGINKTLEDIQSRSDERFEALQEQITKLTSVMVTTSARTPSMHHNPEDFQRPSHHGPSQHHPPKHTDDFAVPPPADAPTNPPNNFEHVDSVDPEFMDTEQQSKMQQFLDTESFTMESGRGTVQYGAKYKYMGSNCNDIKDIPPPLQDLLDRINSNLDYELNSVLINKYVGEESFLPEHSDDELSINPQSSIVTVSIGAPRTILFRNSFTGEEHEVEAGPGSLYTMSRDSQAVYKHRILKDPAFEGKVRYSITLRSVHWKFLNSAILVGDSNTGPIVFGEGRGKVGASTPGKRVESIHIEDINPPDCASYSNVVLMVGTNNLKGRSLEPEAIKDLVNVYRDKIQEIRVFNKHCKIFIVPVIPSCSENTNKNIGYFNDLVVNGLVQHFKKLFIVWGTSQFADVSSGRLAPRFCKSPDPSGLHLNRLGTSHLVRIIKNRIFESRRIGNRVHSSRSYANVTVTGRQ